MSLVFPYKPSHFCKISSNVLSFISEFSNLSLLFSWSLEFCQFCCFFLKEPTFSYVDFLPWISIIYLINLQYFLPSAWFWFSFFFYILKVEGCNWFEIFLNVLLLALLNVFHLLLLLHPKSFIYCGFISIYLKVLSNFPYNFIFDSFVFKSVLISTICEFPKFLSIIDFYWISLIHSFTNPDLMLSHSSEFFISVIVLCNFRFSNNF